jgi:hypothetical protein
MATKLTYEGVDAVVELDDHAVTLHGAIESSAGARGDESTGEGPSSDGDPVVIPRWEVEAARVESASLLSYGRLVITTKAGREHAVKFSRDAQERFETLAAIIG